jgi:Mannosyltransferase (PIG-V)
VIWTHVVFFAVAFGFNASLAAVRSQPLPGFFDLWLKWDAVAFVRIALHGYTSTLTEPHPTAFFPLLPMLLRGLMAIHFSGAGAGLVLAGISSLIAFFYLYRLAETELGPNSGRLSVWYLALFPASVFLVAGYTEPLFLAGAIAAFFYARQGSWPKVALPAALATASRFAGIFVLAALGVEMLLQQRKASGRQTLEAVGALAVGALPAVAYGYFLSRARSDPLFYFTDERLGWHRRLVSPITSFLNTFQHPGAPLEIAAALVALGFVVWALRWKEWSYAVYLGLLLTSLVTSTYYLSIPRLLLSMFPIPVFLAAVTRDRPDGSRLLLVASGALALVGVVTFTYGMGFY